MKRIMYRNLIFFVLLLFFPLISFAQGALDILGKPSELNFQKFETRINKGINDSENMNFESSIFQRMNSKNFSDWYRSSFFYDRNEIYLEILKKKNNKLVNPMPYDKEGQRPLDGYLSARQILFGLNLQKITIENLKEIHKPLLSKDSIRASDANIFLLDGAFKTHSEKTPTKYLGKIRDVEVGWNQGNAPINGTDEFFLLNGERLTNLPKNLRELLLVNPLLSTDGTGFIKYASPRTPKTGSEEFSKYISNLTVKLLEKLKKELMSAQTKNDIITIAGRFQRDFISIHPFLNGNGRLARLITEKILNDYKLPSPIYTYFGYEVTLPESEFLKLFKDAVHLGYKFNSDVLTLVYQNWGYDLVSSHFLISALNPNLVQNIIPFEFMAWSITQKQDPKIQNIQNAIFEFSNWRKAQTKESLLKSFKNLKMNSGVTPDFEYLVNNFSFLPSQRIGLEQGRVERLAAPNKSNPIRTFDGLSYGTKYLKDDCLNPDYGNHPINILEASKKNKSFYNLYELDPYCVPHITFSWMSDSMLNGLYKRYGPKVNNWRNYIQTSFSGESPNALFTSFSPIATAFYGPNQVRIKHKKGVKYYFIKFIKGKNVNNYDTFEACNFLEDSVKQNGIIVRHFKRGKNHFAEYNFCSFGPVHSWSFDRKDNYDEIVKEYLWTQDNIGKSNHVLYLHKNGIPNLFNNIDDNKFTQKLLISRMKEYLEHLEDGESPIIFNPELRQDPSQDMDHYYTTNPVYWNKFGK